MEKPYTLTLKAKRHTWSIRIWESPERIRDMKRDGLTLDAVENTFPDWLASSPLLGVWCALQDWGLLPK